MNNIETLELEIKELQLKINQEEKARATSAEIAKLDRQILKQKQKKYDLLTGKEPEPTAKQTDLVEESEKTPAHESGTFTDL